jgi:hypothetical protein
MALSTRSNPRQTIGVTRARQGRLGRNILWVLVVGTLLVILGFLATYTWKAGDFASVQPSHGARQANAGQFAAPPPKAAVRQNYQTGAPYAPQNNGNPGQPNRSNTAEP